MKPLPATAHAPVIRTDFSDDAGWEALCAAIAKPEELGFTASVDFISDPAYAGLEASQLAAMPSAGCKHLFAFIIDHVALAHPEHPIIVADRSGKKAQTFRVIPKEVAGVESNLSICNMDFEEFIEAVDDDGIFRGFPRPATTGGGHSNLIKAQRTPLPLATKILLALLSAGVLWLWYSFVTFQEDEVNDYGTVTGVLVSAQEHLSSRSGHLNLSLQGDPLRYCVPADGYLDYFNREAFFAEVRTGSVVELDALTSDIAAPQTALLNSTSTVFVRGLRARGREYSTVEDHIAWQRKNNWWGLVLAIAGSSFLAFIFIKLRGSRK